jgi:hypothetical protein
MTRKLELSGLVHKFKYLGLPKDRAVRLKSKVQDTVPYRP